MRAFVTGASGFIGSAVVPELLAAGHEVVGLARSAESAAAVEAAGASVHRGSLDDPDALRAGAEAADGVIHLAFVHDFSAYDRAVATDVRAIETLGSALEASGRPLVVASGLLALPDGRPATERDVADVATGGPRGAGAQATLAFATRGVRASIVRLAPSVHGAGDHGFVPTLIGIAREKGVSGYVGDGANRWPAVHRLDAARLFRLALEKAPAGTVLHGVDDEGVPLRSIADVIATKLGVPLAAVSPQDAGTHFGWLAPFVGADLPATSALTRELLAWQPTRPGLLDDLAGEHYFRPDGQGQTLAAAANSDGSVSTGSTQSR